jgi:hypothetical protein
MQDHGAVPHGAMQCNHDAVPHGAMQKGSDCEIFSDSVYFVLKFLKRANYSYFNRDRCLCSAIQLHGTGRAAANVMPLSGVIELGKYEVPLKAQVN